MKFINLSLGALGAVISSSESFVDLLRCLEFNKPVQRSILSKSAIPGVHASHSVAEVNLGQTQNSLPIEVILFIFCFLIYRVEISY